MKISISLSIRLAGLAFLFGMLSSQRVLGQDSSIPSDEERASQFTIVEDVVSTEGLVNVIVLVSENTGKNGALAQSLARIAKGSVQTYTHFPLMALQVDGDGLAELEQNLSILGIEEDIPHAPTLSESTELIGAQDAWSSGYTGAGITVAILDTGSHLEHDFIKDKIVAEACYSKNVSGSSTSLCPNSLDSETGTGSSAACDANTLGSSCNHGTGVGGVAAGKRYGAVSFDGVAPDANIISINVFSNHNGSVLAWSSDYIAGLDYVYSLRNTYDIAAANLSLGGGQYNSASTCDSERPSTKTAADQLKAAGIAVIAASGNDGYTGYVGAPSCVSSIISVGSTTKADAISSFSNHDDIVDLLAPGSSITTSWDEGDSFSAVNGTSFATPTVTGAWALIREADSTSSVDVLLQAFKDTGVDITGRSGIPAIQRIQVDSAIASLGCGFSWRLEFAVRDRNGKNTTLNLGQGSQNTDALDTSCGESKLPPMPPSGIFAAQFDLPGDTVYAAQDYRSTSADTAEWEINVSGRYPFRLSWDPDRLPTGFFRLRDNIDGARVNVDMKAVSSYSLSNKSVSGLVIQRLETGTCESKRFNSGWNMVSFPMEPLDTRKTAILRSTKTSLYGYDGTSYTLPSRVSPGVGYWVYYRRPKTITFCGYDAGTSVSVSEGWNLVAPHDVDMAVADITSSPSGIVATDFFAYDRGYEATDSLKKDIAYWVRVSSDGALTVQSSGKQAAPLFSYDREPLAIQVNQRDADSSWAVVSFKDGTDIHQTLFYQKEYLTEEDRDYYLLPPLAPGGFFDARFVDDLQVSDQVQHPDTLLLQGFVPPVEVSVENLPYQQLRLHSLKYDTSILLREGVPVTLPSDGSLYTIAVEPLQVSVDEESEVPKEVRLFQNYPNPASTTSSIRFALPAAVHVKVKLYNVLGQSVATVVDDVLAAGYHDVKLDLAPFPSGTFLYTLETPAGRHVRRLTIIR